jgi:hypothetical protein
MFISHIFNDTEVFFKICGSRRGACLRSESVDLNNGTKDPDPPIHKRFAFRNLNTEINSFAPICYIIYIGPIGH